MELRLVGAAVVLLGLMTTSAWAGNKAQPVSSSTLEAMGLGPMQTLEDADGAKVRGKFTFAWVSGFSQVGPTVKSYTTPGVNSASNFKFVFSGGGFAGGGAFAWAN
jgi:hypothetical protein